METLVQLLAKSTGQLRLPGGVTPETLAELRRKIAAVLILGNGALVPVPDDAAADPALQQAAKAGELLAKEWTAKGILMRYTAEPYLAPETDPERPVEVIGPFVTPDLALAQYAFYQPVRFLSVRAGAASIALLPLDTKKDTADPTKWTIPAGTVWISSPRLVPGVLGWTGLRVSGGTLSVPSASLNGNLLIIAPDKPWTLTIAPERSPATAAGNDGSGAAVTLPTQLELKQGARSVTGSLELTGFGTALKFTAPQGVPTHPTPDAIHLPYAAGNATWQIAANRPKVYSLTVAPTPVANPAWALPTTTRGIAQLGEARHGGSLVFDVAAGPRSQVIGTVRESRWEKTTVTVNARGVEMHTDKAASDISMEVLLWNQSRTTAKLSDTTAGIAVRHASRRGGPDIATVTRGTVATQWDRPLTATGAPYDYTGRVDSVAFIIEPTALRRLVLDASEEPDTEMTQGYVLENLYVHTTPPRRLSLVGSGPTAARLTEGHARLIFDVRLAQPMLPNPYAANWDVARTGFDDRQSALSSTVRWPNPTAPTTEAALLGPIGLPSPPDNREAPFLYLLDVSGRDDQLGVVLTPDATLPSIEQNRLVWPMQGILLTMLPQVLWEPVQIVEVPQP